MREFKFECPLCGQHLSATPEQTGISAPCPACGSTVQVPANQAPPPLPPVDRSNPIPPAPHRPEQFESIQLQELAALLMQQRATPKPPCSKAAAKVVVLALIAVFLYLSFSPWTHYKWASWKDTVSAYQGALLSFPNDSRAPHAEERIRVLLLEETRRRADAEWAQISSSRSGPALKRFLASFPGTNRAEDAEARLTLLHNDFTWVESANTIEAYKRYLSQNPASPQRSRIGKKMIDLEVDAIAAGDPGELPKAQLIGPGSGASQAELKIDNETTHELTILFSGLESRKLVIKVFGTASVVLPPGEYKVAASVNDSSVRKYFGVNVYRRGTYATRFYVTGPTRGGTSKPGLFTPNTKLLD